MLKGQKKHINKELGKTKHEAPRSVNYRATQNKNNIRTTGLERSVVDTTGGLKSIENDLFVLNTVPNLQISQDFIYIYNSIISWNCLWCPKCTHLTMYYPECCLSTKFTFKFTLENLAT